MLSFFIINVFGGALKFFYAAANDDLSWVDYAALVYSILAFFAMIIWYLYYGEAPPI